MDALLRFELIFWRIVEVIDLGFGRRLLGLTARRPGVR